MKVFLTKDVEKIGMAGEILKVNDGFARNFLLPRKFAVEITPKNEAKYQKMVREVQDRKEVIASQTSMLADKISKITIKIKKKMHDDGKLYGAISQQEVAQALSEHGIAVGKSQIIFDKSIKSKGTHTATIKLTARLKPTVTISVVSA